jgi:hypothetical protein
MSKINLSPRMRVFAAMVLLLLVIIGLVTLYGDVGLSLGGQSPNKWILTVFGPVLALFTHMSFLLFLPLSVPIVALLCIGVLYPQTRVATAIGFIATWLAIGWFMKDLF